MRYGRAGKDIFISLSATEAAGAGLSCENFGKDDRETRSFLVTVLELLRKKGLIGASPSRLDIEVSEEKGGLGMRIREKLMQNVTVVLFEDPTELEASLGGLSGEPQCQLWKTETGYALIAEGSSIEADPFQMILAAKIREYGKKLSDSPFDLI